MGRLLVFVKVVSLFGSKEILVEERNQCDIELQKNGKNVFAISASQNSGLVSVMHEFLKNGVLPTTSIGFRFDTEEEVKRAYNMLISGGTVHRPKRRHRTFEPRIELEVIKKDIHPDILFYYSSARRGSNPRPPPWQGGAPPLSHSRMCSCEQNILYTIMEKMSILFLKKFN